MGVPVRALLPGTGGGRRRRRGGRLQPPFRPAQHAFSLSEPATQLQSHVRNVAQWAELRAAERRRFCGRIGTAAGQDPTTVEHDLERGRFLSADEALQYGILDEVARPDAPVRQLPGTGPPPMGFRPCAEHETRPVLRAYDAAMTTNGPRLPPLAAGEWDAVLTRVLENSPGGTDEPMHIFTTLGRADPICSGAGLAWRRAVGGGLPGRLRELVILRTAARSTVGTSGRSTLRWPRRRA